ncbi:Helo-like-N domain-containing protein [Fusarium sp. LHS14.1]|nr:Helo-like-N domain-containing protein [Fusarium sp. LHS14.1]
MNPASLAFGVVSLAMQLMQTTTAIKKLIADYKSAAKDLAVLSDKLDDIEAVCHSLEVVLANFDEIWNPWETTLLSKLYKAINDCRDKVSLVYDAVHKVTGRHKSGRASLATVGSLFLQHRAQIRQCNDDLDRSLSSLQLHMTTNLLAANMRPSVLPRRGHALSSVPSVVEGRSKGTVSVTNRNRTFSTHKDSSDTLVTQWRWGWSTLGYLQTKQTLKTTPGLSGAGSPKTQQHLSFLAAIPILKLYVKMSVRQGSLSPLSVSLHFPHVIDVTPGLSEIGDQLAGALVDDNVEVIRDYFCKSLLTPFSTMTWSLYRGADDETTFYGYSVLYSANNVCRFLVEQLSDSLQRTSSHISLMPPLVNSRVSFGLKQLIFDYIDLRGDSFTPLEFSRVLHQLSLARDVKIFVEYCKQRFSDEWGPFNFCVYAYLVGVFQPWNSWRRYDLLDDWAPVLADVLSNGVDIHTSTWVHKPLAGGLEGLSAVHSIISMADSPQMALERCSLWLNLLEQVGVDIEQYLDVEISHCIATWDQKRKEKGTEFRKIFTIQEYGGRRMPCWIQEIDGVCPIRELLLEFPHIQKGYILYYLDLKS